MSRVSLTSPLGDARRRFGLRTTVSEVTDAGQLHNSQLPGGRAMTTKQHRCETCRLRALAEKKPQSLLARSLALAHGVVSGMEIVPTLARRSRKTHGSVMPDCSPRCIQ